MRAARDDGERAETLRASALHARRLRGRSGPAPGARPVRASARDGGAQKMRTATSAGASNSWLSSSSSRTSVTEAPAMSSEVQYSPT